jgi:hypothetical protein
MTISSRKRSRPIVIPSDFAPTGPTNIPGPWKWSLIAMVDALFRNAEFFSRMPARLLFPIWRIRLSRPYWRRQVAMDQGVYVAQMNIEHFRRKLLEEQNELTRQQIDKLLAAE